MTAHFSVSLQHLTCRRGMLTTQMLTVACAIGAAALGLPAAQAQDRIFRCGNEYTNSPSSAQKKDCKQIEGGNVTVVPATKPNPSAGNRAGGQQTASADHPKVDPAQQKARDSDARTILEGELRRAEARLADLQRDYNNGQPDKKTDELRNVARYQERVAELKASIARAEADVTGIKRELQRATGGAANASSSASAR